MTRIVGILGTCIAALALAVPAATAKTTAEQWLLRATKDRVADPAVPCIIVRQVRHTNVADRTAIIYESGRFNYLNYPLHGAENLDSRYALVSQVRGTRLCKGDIVQIERSGGHYGGFVTLGDFIPYRRAR